MACCRWGFQVVLKKVEETQLTLRARTFIAAAKNSYGYRKKLPYKP